MNKRKKIFIEASNLIETHPTGIPKYSKNIISQFTNNDDLRSNFDLSLLLSASRWKKRHLCPTFEGVEKKWALKKILLKNDVDLIHYTGVFTNHYKKVPKVITVHDIAVLMPEHQIPYYTSQETINKTREDMKNIANNVNAIIFVSETTRQDFLKLYSFPFENTHVVYPGSNYGLLKESASDETVLDKYKLRSKKYYLMVGGISIRKNVLNLVKAFLLNKHQSDFDLLLVGNNGMGADLILEEIKRNDINGRIKCPGFVPDDDIVSLYRNAGALAFPTYYEGFGVPIIDAMNFGIPILVGNKGAAPEISGEFATMVDPFDVNSIASGLEKVLDTNDSVLKKAKEHAKTFTWKRCADQIFDVYRKILGK